MLRKLRAKLTRLARTAEDFRSLASPDWAPRIGAYINTAHWLSHSLQEAAGPLLLLDLEGRSHSETPDRRPLQAPVIAQVSTGYRQDCPAYLFSTRVITWCATLSAVMLAADSREGSGTVLSCEAEAYAGFKQKWTLKLARTVSSIFADKTAAYRRRSNFEGLCKLWNRQQVPCRPTVQSVFLAYTILPGLLSCAQRGLVSAQTTCRCRLHNIDIVGP